MEQIIIEDLKEEYEHLSSDGFRVLAVAYKDLEPRAAYSKEDESDLILIGYVAFLDPPKETAAPAIEALQRHGVTVKVLTGDNELVSRKVCHEVGLPTEHMVLGGAGRDDVGRGTWRRRSRRRRFLPGFRPPTSSGSSRRCSARGTWWGSWATASTTPPACGPPTWASRSIRPWTSPRNRPT